MRSIVVPFDFSPESERGLNLALQGIPFGAEDATVTVCHVVDERLYKRVIGTKAIPTDQAIESYLNEYIDRQRAELGPRAVVPHALQVVRGEPLAEILSLAKVAHGVIIGGQGHGGIAERVIGRTGQRVIRSCDTSVYAVKERTLALKEGPVLCAIDFARGSKEALRRAYDLSRAQHRLLELVHVVEVTAAPYIDVGAIALDRSLAEAGEDLARYEREMLGAHTAARRHIELGEPASTITRVADEIGAAVVVLGWHGHGATEHVLLGSVSENVAVASPVDVWIVRGP